MLRDVSNESAELIAGFQLTEHQQVLGELEGLRNRHENLVITHKRNCEYIYALEAEIEVLKATEELRRAKKRLKKAFKAIEALNKS